MNLENFKMKSAAPRYRRELGSHKPVRTETLASLPPCSLRSSIFLPTLSDHKIGGPPDVLIFIR